MSHRRSTLVLAAAALAVALAAPAAAATLELSGPAGATVSLNDRVLGEFPLDGPLDLPPGNYTIRCTLAGHEPYVEAVRLAAIGAWQRVDVRLVPYSRRTAWSSNLLLAGLGQHYLDKGFRGYVYNAAEIGGLLTALVAELRRSNLQDDYLVLVDLYNGTVNADEITRLRGLADGKYQDMEDMESLRDTGLLVAGAAVAVSIADALINFPSVAAGGGAVPVQTAAVALPDVRTAPSTAVHAGIRLAF